MTEQELLKYEKDFNNKVHLTDEDWDKWSIITTVRRIEGNSKEANNLLIDILELSKNPLFKHFIETLEVEFYDEGFMEGLEEK